MSKQGNPEDKEGKDNKSIGLNNTEVLDFLRVPRLPFRLPFDEKNFEERLKNLRKKQCIPIARELPYQNRRTLSYPEYAFVQDRIERIYPEIYTRVIQEYREKHILNLKEDIIELCGDPPVKLRRVLESKTSGFDIPRDISYVGRITKLFFNRQRKEEVKELVATELVPLLGEIASNFPEYKYKTIEQQQQTHYELTKTMLALFGIQVDLHPQTSQLRVNTMLDRESVLYVRDLLRIHSKNFSDRLTHLPITQNELDMFLAKNPEFLSAQIIKDPEVLTFHAFASMLDFIKFPFTNNNSQREAEEDRIIFQLITVLNERNYNDNTEVLANVSGYFWKYIAPYFGNRSSDGSEYHLASETYQSDFPLEALDQAFIDFGPIGLNLREVEIKFRRQFDEDRPGKLGHVLLRRPLTMDIYSLSKDLPTMGLVEGNIGKVRLMGQLLAARNIYDYIDTIRHEFGHLWLLKMVVEESKEDDLQALVQSCGEFLVFYFKQKKEFQVFDIFTHGIGVYPEEILTKMSDENYAQEIIAEIAKKTVDPFTRERIQDKLPGHYMIYRAMYEPALYEVFRRSLVEYVRGDKEAVVRFIEFTENY